MILTYYKPTALSRFNIEIEISADQPGQSLRGYNLFHMRPLEETQQYMILLLLFILVALSGLTPHPHALKENLVKSNGFISRGAHSQAAQTIAQATEHQPWQSNLWEKASHYALLGNEPQIAIDYLERASLTTNSPIFQNQKTLSFQGLIDLGQAYQMIGNSDAALKAWQKAEDLYGPTDKIMQQRVDTFLSQGNTSSAIIELQRMAEFQLDNPSVEYQLGLLLCTQDPVRAIPHLKKATELNPEVSAFAETIIRNIQSASYADDPAYSLLSSGRALALINEWWLAAEAFRQAILLKPGYAEAWAYLGESLQHLNVDSTSNAYSRNGLHEIKIALELDPESLAAHSFLALYWKRHDRFDLALEAMQNAVRLDANNALLQSELAGIQAASGDLDSAYRSYLQAVDLAPNDPAYQRLLVTFSLTYDYNVEEIALQTARRLVIYDSQNPRNLDLMAQVLIKQGDLSNAERFLQRALVLDPNFGAAHLHLGLVYMMRSNQQEAFQEFNLAKSLSTDPSDTTTEHAQRLLNTYFP